MKRSRLLALLVVGAFVLAGCGGGDDGGGDGAAADGDDGGGVDSPFDAAQCAEVVTAMAAAAAAIPQAMSGEIGDLGTSVEQMEAFAEAAPEEIRDDLVTVAQGYAAYTEALAESGYDPASGVAPPPEVIAALTAAGQALQGSDFTEASARVSAWFESECGG